MEINKLKKEYDAKQTERLQEIIEEQRTKIEELKFHLNDTRRKLTRKTEKKENTQEKDIMLSPQNVFVNIL